MSLQERFLSCGNMVFLSLGLDLIMFFIKSLKSLVGSFLFYDFLLLAFLSPIIANPYHPLLLYEKFISSYMLSFKFYT